MHTLLLYESNLGVRRRSSSQGCGLAGCFVAILILGLVLYVILRGRRDRPEQLGASKRPLGSGPIELKTFTCPFAKCPNCGAAGSKMRQAYDGFRSVTWTCGYCGHAQVQELQDHELPPQVRQRLGLDPQPSAGWQPGWNEPMGGSPFGGAGGLLTGMMLGSMMSGGLGHGVEPSDDASEEGGSGGDAGWGEDAGSDWGDGGNADSDWGDGGGGFGGGDDW